jgi:hypothetical protein
MGGGGGGGSSLVLKNVINWGVPDACRTRVQQMRGKRSGQEKCTRTKKRRGGGSQSRVEKQRRSNERGPALCCSCKGPVSTDPDGDPVAKVLARHLPSCPQSLSHPLLEQPGPMSIHCSLLLQKTCTD